MPPGNYMETSQDIEVKLNKAFEAIFRTTAKYIILRGGSGSGKSYAVADYIILSMLSDSHRWIVARKYATTIRQSVFTLIIRRISEMGLSGLFKVNKSEMYIEGPNDSSIVFVGLDDVNKLKSLYNPTDAFMEEADQCTQDDSVVPHIDRHIQPCTIFVLLPRIGTKLALKINRSRRDMLPELLHRVNAVPYRIGTLDASMDIKPSPVDFLD